MKKNTGAIYDAKTLGKPKMILLGVQHMFAMFGATILVPIITGLDISTTLLMAGLGTLLFHLLTKFQVPAFLGSSFAFLGGYAAIKALNPENPNSMLPYACLGVACAGLLYFVLAAIIKTVGINKVMRFFPPVVTGPIIIAIGLGLAPSAVGNCSTNWILALVALAVIVVFNIWGRGMAKIIPIILGLVISYAVGLVLYFIGEANPQLIQDLPWLFSGGFNEATGQYTAIFDFSQLNTIFTNISQGNLFGSEGLIGIPVIWEKTVFGGVDFSNGALIASSIIAIMPIALATMMEHIGDICAIGSTTGKNYIENPGLHRTLLGDGVGSIAGAFFGGCPNTTYGESVGCVAITGNASVATILATAILCIISSFFAPFVTFLSTIPSCVMGGVCITLYGFIAVSGLKMIQAVDLGDNKNLFVVASILIAGVGGMKLLFGKVTLTSVACALILGIIVNAVLSKKKVTSYNTESETTDAE